MPEPVSAEIEALLKEDRSFAPTDEFRSQAVINDPGIYEKAAKDPEAFWAGFARELEWIKPWSKVLEWNAPDAKWFVGGQLNVAANCLDRHVRTCAAQQGGVHLGRRARRSAHADLFRSLSPGLASSPTS